jgi:hypothetical protein
MLEHALKYARMGRPVFPCALDKKPLCARGFLDATTDEGLIRSAWAAHPGASIGTPTGNGSIVIDVDGEGGERTIEEASFWLSDLPPTATVRTGRGKHLWYKTSHAIRCSAGKLGPGLDVRGDGGYVILPPSPHPSGSRYEWESKIPLAELPQDWAEALVSYEPESTDALQAPPEPIPQGKRNSTLTSLAGALRRRGMSEDAVLGALLAANKAQCSPPLPESDVVRIARSVGRYRPGTIEPPARTSKLIVESFDRIEPKRLEWLWPARIPLGKLTILAGDPGLGKSLITLDLAARLSTSGLMPDGAQGPVGDTIFLSAEDDPSDTIRPRLDAAGADVKRIHFVQGVGVESGQGNEKWINLQTDLRLLEDLVKGVRPAMVVIDPISAYMGEADAYSNAQVRRVLGPLSAMAQRHGVAVVAINHLRKAQGDPLTRVAMSIAFTAAARAVWGVQKDPKHEGQCLVFPIKANLGGPMESIAFSVESRGGCAGINWLCKRIIFDPPSYFFEKKLDMSCKT